MPALQFCIFPIELHLSGKGQITLRAIGVNLPLLRTLEQKASIFYEPRGHRGEKGKRDRSEKFRGRLEKIESVKVPNKEP